MQNGGFPPSKLNLGIVYITHKLYIEKMELPHHIAIAYALKEEKYYVKFLTAIEIADKIYVIKLPIALFRMFMGLAVGAVTSQTGFVTHLDLYTRGKVMPPRSQLVYTTLTRLEKSLIEQTNGKWPAPIERNSYRRQARLNISENECEFEFNLSTLIVHAKDSHVRTIARRIAATWDRTAEPAFKKKESRRKSEVQLQKRGCFLVRGGQAV